MTTWLSIDATPPWTARPDLNEAMLRCGTRATMKRSYSAPSSNPLTEIVQALESAVPGLSRGTNLFVAGEDALLGSATELPINFVTVELRPGQSQPFDGDGGRGLTGKPDVETYVVEVVGRSRAGDSDDAQPWTQAQSWAFACYDAIIALVDRP